MVSKRGLWIQLLWVEGIFLVSLGLGLRWLQGPISGGSRDQSSLGLFVGGLGLVALGSLAWILSRQIEKKKLFKILSSRNRAVSLDESFRAYRAFGEQSPLYQDASLQSEVFSIDSPKSYGLKNLGIKGSQRLIVEHWEGPDLWVRCPQRSVKLAPRQVVKIDLAAGENILLEPENFRNLKFNERVQGLVHFVATDL